MKGLTEKQQNIIRFIGEFTVQEHMAPTVYELADHFHIKTSTIFAHLKALQQKGMLTRTSQARSIKLPAPPSRSAALPDIVALPLEDPSGGIGEWLVDRHLFDADHREEGFALKISDDALRDFGIFPGDIVIVYKIETLTAGQLIAVKTTDATLVRSGYLHQNGLLELRPANPDFPTLTYPASAVTIRGAVIVLQREY